MTREGVLALAACLIFAWLETGAVGQGGLLYRHLQEDETPTPCSSAWELTASKSSSGPSEIRSALAEAGECAIVGDVYDSTPSVVSVRWEGSIQTEEPFVVPSGVELRVDGNGWFSSYEDINKSSSDNGEGAQEADAELKAAIADAAAAEGQDLEPSAISSSVSNTSMFVVEAGGALRLSKIVLAGEWGADGGGAVRSVGGEVTGEDLWWKSLVAEGAGGAIFAEDGANVTLKGLNLFQGCSSSTLGGGALLVDDSICSVDNSAQVYFESCSASTDGGGVQLSSSTLTASSNSKTRFRGCSTRDKGGGLYMRSSAVRVDEAASLEFQGCASGNISGAKGGGVCSYESTVTVGAGAVVTFVNNSSPMEDGGGLFGQTTYIKVAGDGAALVFTENSSGDSGGGLALETLDTDEEKDCLALAEGSNAYFSGNKVVEYGGGALFTSCHASVSGNVSFRENIGERAGALYLHEARLLVDGDASFVGNSAHRWGGAVFVLDSVYAEDNGLRLTGDVDCSGNAAGRSGGCIYIENGDVTIARDLEGEGEGPSWVGNIAGYDGGVIAVDGGGVRLEGGYASSNSAAERGGALFGIGESTIVWQGGESWNNTAAAGGSLYVSGSTANLTDLRLDGDHTPSGANIFLAGGDVRAVNMSIIAPEDLEATFALRVDSRSMFRAFACSFDQWGGDSPAVVSGGELVMDLCNFSGSTTPILVHASRAVTIRNAILGDNNRGQAEFNASSPLGVGVHTCASIPEELSCTVPDKCGDADNGMGVLCPSFTEAATGGVFSLATANGSVPDTVELTVTISAASVTSSLSEIQVVYHPELVTQELALRHTASTGVDNDPAEGAGGVLWELVRIYGDGGGSEGGQSADETGMFTGISPDNFTWTALPSSGFLVWGQEVTIQMVGNPPLPLNPSAPFAVYNGEVSANFSVLWWTEEPASAVESSVATIESIFYFCREGYFWDGETCVSCVEEMATIDEGEGAFDCSVPGVTLDTLPLSEGYWRGDVAKTYVHHCLDTNACVGGRGMDSSSSSFSDDDDDDDEDENVDSVDVAAAATNATTSNIYDDSRYCVEGHKGAYCSVCVDGYRRFSGGQLCVSCTGGWGSGIRAMLCALALAACFLLMTLVVFLIGGPTAVSQLKEKFGCCSCCRRRQRVAATDFSESSAAPRTESAMKVSARTFGARMLRAVPFQNLKILIVVWQIVTQFSSLADIPYPPKYQRFLNLLDVFNFDITWPLTASCVVSNISFYQKLLGVTLGPLAALAFLGTTYALAINMHRWGFGQISAKVRQGAVERHASAALLVLFLVYSSVSTTVFSTYACDFMQDLDVSLLRADYNISCDDRGHVFYKVYAAIMILLYPVGIPVLFSVLLLKRRDKINPSLPAVKLPCPWGAAAKSNQIRGRSSRPVDERGRDDPEAAWAVAGTKGVSAALDEGCPSRSVGAEGGRRGRRKGMGDGGWDTAAAPAVTVAAGVGATVSFEEVLKNRARDPDLQSTRFLWAPYDPNKYYFETVECARRCLLTGALVFVLPNTAGQVAGACVFGFVSLLAFELLRPHLSQTDSWMYRTGCIVIFFSNFLALMAKADVSSENAQSEEVFGLLLIAVHASMVIAVFGQAYLSVKSASESWDDLEAFWKKEPSKYFKSRKIISTAESGGGDSGGSTGASVVASRVGGKMKKHTAPADGAAVSERGADADHHVTTRRCEETYMPRREMRRDPDTCKEEKEEKKEEDGVEGSIEMESVYLYSHRENTDLAAGGLGLPSAVCTGNTGGGSKPQQQGMFNRFFSRLLSSYSNGGSNENEACRSVVLTAEARQSLRQSTATSGGGGGGYRGREAIREVRRETWRPSAATTIAVAPSSSVPVSLALPVRRTDSLRRPSIGGGGGGIEPTLANTWRDVSAHQQRGDHSGGGGTTASASSGTSTAVVHGGGSACGMAGLTVDG